MGTSEDVTGPMNLGNPHEIAMTELAERVLALSKSRSRIVYRPLPQDDPLQRCPDIGMARQALAWEPKVPLDEGLGRTIEYFRKLLHNRGSRGAVRHFVPRSTSERRPVTGGRRTH